MSTAACGMVVVAIFRCIWVVLLLLSLFLSVLCQFKAGKRSVTLLRPQRRGSEMRRG
ncbi:hypothetical protein BJX64DRAFT_259413 [Aspergillus heterothallicus]